MHHLVIVSLFVISVMTAGKGLAETNLTPNDVRERFPLIQRAPCTDQESGEGGLCFLFDAGNSFYMVFTQQGVAIFMRHVVPPNPYQTIWRADTPQGIAL